MNLHLRPAIIGFFLYLFCLTVLLLEAKAQTPGPLFRYLTTSDGLGFDDVRSIYQDQKGFMWIGTDGGVDRYDGIGFTSFTYLVRDTTDNLLQGAVGFTEDHLGNLWIVNDTNGLVMINKYRTVGKRYIHNPADPKSFSSRHIRKIYTGIHFFE
jgi:hypothetical protein